MQSGPGRQPIPFNEPRQQANPMCAHPQKAKFLRTSGRHTGCACYFLNVIGIKARREQWKWALDLRGREGTPWHPVQMAGVDIDVGCLAGPSLGTCSCLASSVTINSLLICNRNVKT